MTSQDYSWRNVSAGWSAAARSAGIPTARIAAADSMLNATRSEIGSSGFIWKSSFSRYFAPIHNTLLTLGDHYMHLADLKSYLDADRKLLELYARPDGWVHRTILNVAASGKFSSDRTIAEYAREIWGAKPCPVL